MTGDDPTPIRSLAVSADDVADAYAYSHENPGRAILRVIPPFHGRMRARIHVYRVDDAALTDAIHVPPEELLEDDVVAAYPSLEDALATDSETEEVRTRHAEAVDAWRSRARESIVDAVELEIGDEPHRVDVKRLG
ncbi:hypothetical protein [Natrialba sp. INN-245]|uniref:hypothetical protein n=1 Tax=Natrialba sp. INN-245 TaxID=2690967 RepID=UPI00131123EF|nr:hypothetical protein [Natrialba sp. INN-245]MWV40156.1 hypothetical protein [Natrialba sp. INN-245]